MFQLRLARLRKAARRLVDVAMPKTIVSRTELHSGRNYRRWTERTRHRLAVETATSPPEVVFLMLIVARPAGERQDLRDQVEVDRREARRLLVSALNVLAEAAVGHLGAGSIDRRHGGIGSGEADRGPAAVAERVGSRPILSGTVLWLKFIYDLDVEVLTVHAEQGRAAANRPVY